MSGHEGELKAALRRLPAPDVSPDLLQRILHSRAMGVRARLPTRAFTVPWRWVASAAAVVVLIGGSWLVSLSLSELGKSRAVRDPLDELLRGTRLWPTPGGGEDAPREPSHPKYPLILSDALDPSRLREGTWTYQATTTIDDILTQPYGRHRVRVSRATYAGRPAWTVNTAMETNEGWTDYLDTVYIDAASLRPQYAVEYGNKRRTRIVQTFSGDSGRESIDFTGPMKGSYRGAIAFPFPHNALFVNDYWSLDRVGALLPALPLARGWRGSLYQVAFVSRVGIRGVTPLDLRVAGSDRVMVPAGTFECWRVEVGIRRGEAERRTLWVSRDKGWVIKVQTRGSYYVEDKVLQHYEPGS